MSDDPLRETAVDGGGRGALLDAFRRRAAARLGADTAPALVVSPYRFNPLGAHVDHQGGAVLGRTLDQYTLLAFRPAADERVELLFDPPEGADEQPGRCRFRVGDAAPGGEGEERRARYATAAAAALASRHPLVRGIDAVVRGTLVGAGLSSSASVTLAYLVALAAANGLALAPAELVELVRVVENEGLGLANGVQDQMSIVFGRPDALSSLDVDARTASAVADPPTANAVRWLVLFSGVSRSLAAGSGYNDRVAECREAAARLHPGAGRLCDVPPARRGEAALATLPGPLARRARHVFTEVQRVAVGRDAWRHGDFAFFGELMNASCRSSIEQYESADERLVALHESARGVEGVLGSRFSGGGYGGCLVALVEREATARVARTLLEDHVARHPDLAPRARAFVARAEGAVRVDGALPAGRARVGKGR